MSCCKAIRALSHVGFIVENVLLLYEGCWSQPHSTVWQKQTFNFVLFTTYSIFLSLSCVEIELYRKGFWAVTANLVQRNALSPYIKWPSWANQTENRPLLYFCCTLKAALANFPLWKPHMAAPDIYLHFRAYERLQCNRASEGLTRYIFG